MNQAQIQTGINYKMDRIDIKRLKFKIVKTKSLQKLIKKKQRFYKM